MVYTYGVANHREIFFAYTSPPYACHFCEVTFPGVEVEVVHHLDHDHSNNEPSNLVASHRGCHQGYHSFHRQNGRAKKTYGHGRLPIWPMRLDLERKAQWSALAAEEGLSLAEFIRQAVDHRLAVDDGLTERETESAGPSGSTPGSGPVRDTRGSRPGSVPASRSVSPRVARPFSKQQQTGKQ